MAAAACDRPPGVEDPDFVRAFQAHRAASEGQLVAWLAQFESLAAQLRQQQHEQLGGFERLLQSPCELSSPHAAAWQLARYPARESSLSMARKKTDAESCHQPSSESPMLDLTLDSIVVVDEDKTETRASTDEIVSLIDTPQKKSGHTSAQAWAEQTTSLKVAHFSPKQALPLPRTSGADEDLPTPPSKIFERGVTSRIMTVLARGNTMATNWKDAFARRTPKKKLWKIKPLATFVNRTEYQIFGSLIIVLNAAFVGARAQTSFDRRWADLQGIAPGASTEAFFQDSDKVFCVWFTVELFLNFIADPNQFVDRDNWRWNMFDSVLVANCLLEAALAGTIKNVGSYVRSLRVFRAARMLRIVRVFRVFTSLRLMVYAIMQSMISLLWVFTLLSLLMYVFAIFFLNAANDYASQATVDDPILTDLHEYYGSVPKCLFSLFLAISGGNDWEELMRPLQAVNYYYRFLYMLFIFFVVFGVLNVVTGAFVDSFVVVSQRDRDVVIEDQIKRERKYMQDIQRIFEGADSDGSGMLTLEEFEAHLKDGRVKAFFQTLELDTSQARVLFMLLDADDTNEVGIDEFITGCTRLKGNAKSIDVNMLLYESEYMISRINAGLDRIEDKLNCSPNHQHTLKITEAASKMKARAANMARRPSFDRTPLFRADNVDVL